MLVGSYETLIMEYNNRHIIITKIKKKTKVNYSYITSYGLVF